MSRNNTLSVDEINKMISTMSLVNTKSILNNINHSFDNDTEVLISAMFVFLNKLKTFSTDSVNEIATYLDAILHFLKPLNDCSILFFLLEQFSAKKDEIHRIKILEILSSKNFTNANLLNLLAKNDTNILISGILKYKEEFTEEFIRESLKLDSMAASKNISLIFPNLEISYFLNYKSFVFLCEKEHFYLRNCFIEILERLILFYKEESNIEAIKELTLLINERLIDVNFYVRNKALGSLGNLFRNDSILKEQRNCIIKEIIERAKDKTVIVRKRSINLLSQILVNHPFKNRKTLESYREDTYDHTTNEMNLNKIDVSGSPKSIMENDFHEFVLLMKYALEVIASLLDFNFKTDISEISNFIKWAYLLKLDGSKEAIFKILGVVFTKEKDVVIDVFKEIFAKKGDILYEFINDKAFEVILQSLDVDERILFKNIYNGEMVFESVYVLKQIRHDISEQNAISLLNHITNILFSSKDETELNVNVQCYNNSLSVIKNLKYRIEHNHEIFGLVIKNTIKMVFFDRSIIKTVVELIYSLSISPEATTQKLMKNLVLSKSKLKILDSLGWIGLNQFYLLEKLEKRFKNSKILQTAGIPTDLNVREKRKSLEESRRSSLGRLSLDNKSEIFKLSLKLDDFEQTLLNKSEEEAADYFFYLRETELLYSKNSMLHQFMPLLKESLSSSNQDILITAYSSLFKLMLTSSSFFNENFSYIKMGLEHSNHCVRNVSVVALHDFIVFYNNFFDPSILFDNLLDPQINKNVILVIFTLLQKNIIKIKNNSLKIIKYLFDPELGSIIRTLVKALSNNNNIISILFFETCMSDLGVEFVEYLSAFVASNIQESLFLKCLKTEISHEKLKVIFDNFELDEKFIKENLFRKGMKELLDEK